VPSAARSQVGTALVFDAEGLIGYYRMPLPEVTPGFRGMCTAPEAIETERSTGGIARLAFWSVSSRGALQVLPRPLCWGVGPGLFQSVLAAVAVQVPQRK
jgi:hypothetical protein